MEVILAARLIMIFALMSIRQIKILYMWEPLITGRVQMEGPTGILSRIGSPAHSFGHAPGLLLFTQTSMCWNGHPIMAICMPAMMGVLVGLVMEELPGQKLSNGLEIAQVYKIGQNANQSRIDIKWIPGQRQCRAGIMEILQLLLQMMVWSVSLITTIQISGM